MRSVLLALLLAACGSEPGGAVDLRPESPEPRVEPEQPPLDDPEPDAVRYEVPESPDELPEVSQLERGRRVLSRTAAWSTPTHPDPVVQRRLAMLFEHIAYARAFTSNWGGDRSYWSDARPYGGCRPAVATENVVSVACYRSSTHRGGNTSESLGSSVHLSVVGREIVPFGIEDVFKPGTNMGSLATEEACVESVMATGVRRMLAVRGCREMLADATHWLMGPKGFVKSVNRTTGEVGITLPYTLFREHLRPDGPIAWLYAGPRPRLWVSEADAMGHAVTGVLPWPEMIALADTLPSDALAEVRAHVSGQTARLVLPGTDLGRAREIAEMLGGTVRRARWSEQSVYELRRVRAKQSLSLVTSARAEASIRRRVPEGTHLISMEPASAGSIRVGRAHELVGWARHASLDEDRSCRPDPSAFLESFENRDEAVPRLQVASTEIRRGADQEPTRVALFASTTGGRTRVRLVAMDGECALGDTLLDESLRGHLFDLQMGSLTEGTGESFLLAGVYQGERTRRYFAYRMAPDVNQRRVLADVVNVEEWADQESDPISQVRVGHGEGEDWRPVVLGERDYQWNGRMLVGRALDDDY